jgi:hypothetical protein
MNGGTKSGVSTIILERLQCARRYSSGPIKEQEIIIIIIIALRTS